MWYHSKITELLIRASCRRPVLQWCSVKHCRCGLTASLWGRSSLRRHTAAESRWNCSSWRPPCSCHWNNDLRRLQCAVYTESCARNTSVNSFIINLITLHCFVTAAIAMLASQQTVTWLLQTSPQNTPVYLALSFSSPSDCPAPMI